MRPEDLPPKLGSLHKMKATDSHPRLEQHEAYTKTTATEKNLIKPYFKFNPLLCIIKTCFSLHFQLVSYLIVGLLDYREPKRLVGGLDILFAYTRTMRGTNEKPSTGMKLGNTILFRYRLENAIFSVILLLFILYYQFFFFFWHLAYILSHYTVCLNPKVGVGQKNLHKTMYSWTQSRVC